MKRTFLNYKILISGIIIASIIYVVVSLNYNYSNCSNFPIYMKSPFFYGNFSVNSSLNTRSAIFTQKNNQSVEIAELDTENNHFSLVNQAILRADYDDKEQFNLAKKEVIADYSKLKECVKNNEKYIFEPLPYNW